MKRLLSNLNSRYVDAANSLQKKTKKRIVAYVESYDDVFFWRTVLQSLENDERTFEVMLPSRTNLNRGKKTAMMNSLGEHLGEYMIACVDADMDYLMQGATHSSRQMLDNPYVIHTCSYAIENLQCYAPSLHEVSVMATLNDRQFFDFEAYLRDYSRAIYDLFIWAVWLYRQGRFTEFPLTKLNNFITVEQINIYKPEEAINRVRHNVNRKIAWMQRNYPEAKGRLNPLKTELETLGVCPDNTYLFIQGHHLMDNVVSSVIVPVCTVLRREREKEIKRLAEHTQQMDNELACYQHSQCSVEAMIRRNTNFKESEPYRHIIGQLTRLLDNKTTEEATL